MQSTEFLQAVQAKYPTAVLDVVFVNHFFEREVKFEDITKDKVDSYVEQFKKWMEFNSYWMERPALSELRINKEELPALCEQYHCTPDEIVDVIFQMKGMTLIVEDPVFEGDKEFTLVRDELVVVWKRSIHRVNAPSLDEAVVRVQNNEVEASSTMIVTSPVYPLPAEGTTYTPSVYVSEMQNVEPIVKL